MDKPRKIYLAAPLFNPMELCYNLDLADTLSRYFEVFLPQRDGLLLRELLEQGLDPGEASKTIFKSDIAAMDDADVILAVLNGGHIDEGVAFELGYCWSKGKTCIGLKEDIRQALPGGDNPMISNCLEVCLKSNEELLTWLKTYHLPIHIKSS